MGITVFIFSFKYRLSHALFIRHSRSVLFTIFAETSIRGQSQAYTYSIFHILCSFNMCVFFFCRLALFVSIIGYYYHYYCCHNYVIMLGLSVLRRFRADKINNHAKWIVGDQICLTSTKLMQEYTRIVDSSTWDWIFRFSRRSKRRNILKTHTRLVAANSSQNRHFLHLEKYWKDFLKWLIFPYGTKSFFLFRWIPIWFRILNQPLSILSILRSMLMRFHWRSIISIGCGWIAQSTL